jgi:hypothetical protein
VDSAASASERRLLLSVLLQPMLKPLEAAFGEFGDVAIAEFSSALAKDLAS